MSDRADRLMAALSEDGEGVELLLVTSLVNVRYLTGFTGSNGAALIGPDRRVFVTDFRYVEQAAAEVDPSFDRAHHRATGFFEDLVADLLPAGSCGSASRTRHVTVCQHAALRELLR